MSKTPVTCGVETITAERAAELLESNTHNRPKSKAFSQRYANRMLSGEWDFRLPFIIYRDTDGRLHNGQHTLTAIIMAEKERAENKKFYAENGIKGPIGADAVIIDGINPASANYIDIGKKRTQGDVAFRQHYFDEMGIPKSTNAKEVRFPSAAEQKRMGAWLATAAKFVWFRLWHGLKPRASKPFGVEDFMTVIEACPGLIDSVQRVFLENYQSEKALQALCNPAYLAAAHFLMAYSEYDDNFNPMRVEEADTLIDHLANGCGVEKGEAGYELREWLLANAGSTRSNEDLNQLFEALLFGFKCRMDGTAIKRADFKKHLKPDAWCLLGGVDVLPEEEVEVEEPDDSEDGETEEGNDTAE